MCHPSRKLHAQYKQAKKITKKTPKKQAKREEKPNAAQLFFLQNEDILN